MISLIGSDLLIRWERFTNVLLYFKHAYNNMYRCFQCLRYHLWYRASSTLVSNTVDTVGVLLHKSIYGFEIVFSTVTMTLYRYCKLGAFGTAGPNQCVL